MTREVAGPRYKEVIGRCQRALAARGNRLSDWEREFLRDVRDRLRLYGDLATLTARMLNTLHAIEEKLR